MEAAAGHDLEHLALQGAEIEGPAFQAQPVRLLGEQGAAGDVDEVDPPAAPEQLERRTRLGQRLCDAAVKSLAEGPGVPAQALIREGEPPDVILDTAEATGADLIVLGTYGRKGLKRMLLGSVTAQVVSRARADVLVVHGPCQGCHGTYRSILVPYDDSAFSRAALGRACDIAQADGSLVSVLYAIPRYEEMVGFLKTEGIRARLDEEAARIVDGALRYAAGRGLTIATVVADGPAADRVVESVRKSGFELIVMGSHGHRGMERALLGSTAERVILNASCPVLVVKGKEKS